MYLTYPTLEREISILSSQAPEISDRLVKDVCEFVARVRKLPLQKLPSVSETLDFARALNTLQKETLNYGELMGTLSVLLKYPKDIAKLEERIKTWETEAAQRRLRD